MKKKIKKTFDKYWHYRHSVQSPDIDVRFMRKCFRQLKKKEPKIFREDFCSTFSLSCEWVKLKNTYKSIAVDIDRKPLMYGKKQYLPLLTDSQKDRIKIIKANVLKGSMPKADLICALNFSYFTFKERAQLKKYFQNCFRSLNKSGVFIVDCFGGSDCWSANEEATDCDGFTYYWDQDKCDPISHHSVFHIHFKRRGEKKRKKVFTYDWRLWTVPELKDLLKEVGFKKTHVYWEGTDRYGEGDGRFVRKKTGEECESWIAYLASEK